MSVKYDGQSNSCALSETSFTQFIQKVSTTIVFVNENMSLRERFYLVFNIILSSFYTNFAALGAVVTFLWIASTSLNRISFMAIFNVGNKKVCRNQIWRVG